MVSANSNVSFVLVNLATNPATTVGVYQNVTSARAASVGLTQWEIFYQTPKTNRPGAGGIATGGSPNTVYNRRRLERHGGIRTSPSYGIDDPGSAGGQTKESGNFGI